MVAGRPVLELLRDYEQRSLAHVAGSPLLAGGREGWRGLSYRIGQHDLVSSFDEVVEILGVPALTPIPGSQPWLLGLANVRGNLLPVADLKLLDSRGATLIAHAYHHPHTMLPQSQCRPGSRSCQSIYERT